VYQDVILDGETAYAGSRDCRGAWEAMAPYLPEAGAVLDVGSNFGWFGLQLCGKSSDLVVASVEADERSGAVQRRVLESNHSERICLLTARAGAAMARRFAEAGQRFDAVLCMAVLHWMADHREFISTLGAISGRFFIELPDPEEEGAGVEHIRREIGPAEAYLKSVFPDRERTCIARLPSPRDTRLERELWLVDGTPSWSHGRSADLDVSALMRLSPSWPSRRWWDNELRSCTNGMAASARPRILFSHDGLRVDTDREDGVRSLGQLRRLVRQIPERGFLTRRQLWRRRTRRLAGSLLRGQRRLASRLLGATRF
jgi:SAM-dependent methyltransferase